MEWYVTKEGNFWHYVDDSGQIYARVEFAEWTGIYEASVPLDTLPEYFITLKAAKDWAEEAVIADMARWAEEESEEE